MPINRRQFLETALLTGAAVGTMHGFALATPRRAPLRVAVLGVRGRGRAHIKSFKDSPDTEVVVICDPDEGVIGPAMESVPDARFERDLRRVFEDKSIDIVSIATPNHWHALASIWALEAGKHVYVEKPLSHDVGEGRDLYETAKRTGLVLQHGTQARSQPAVADALQWLREGGLGEVRLAHALCYKRRQSIGKVDGPQKPPATLDYDLWTGPADAGPLMRKNLHYDWHWDFNTGNGDIGNQGVHQMDIARWGLGLDRLPARVVSCGGRVGYVDDGNTPNTQVSLFDYGQSKIIFEVRGLPTPAFHNTMIGVVFHGEGGTLVSRGYDKTIAYDNDGKEMRVFTGGRNHVQNFIDAIKSGRPQDVSATAWDGHLSSAPCHMGNVSYELGTPQRMADCGSTFGADADAQDAVARMCDHLAANDLGSETIGQAGPLLEFDAENEQFVGDHAEKANALASRPGRAPFQA